MVVRWIIGAGEGVVGGAGLGVGGFEWVSG